MINATAERTKIAENLLEEYKKKMGSLLGWHASMNAWQVRNIDIMLKMNLVYTAIFRNFIYLCTFLSQLGLNRRVYRTNVYIFHTTHFVVTNFTIFFMNPAGTAFHLFKQINILAVTGIGRCFSSTIYND
jgi:hypothetical protein